MKLQTVETVTIAQAKATVAQAAKVYFSRDSQGRYWVERRRARPICLMGPAGVGKTEIVRQVAQEMDLAFLSYSITHHTRQSVIGLPRLVEGTVEGRRVSMTEYTMSEIIAQVYETMERTGKREGILFLDEFNCVSESLRPILLQLLQDKSFGPHPIPDGWMLVVAGNPTEYNRSAADIDPVTADRLRLVHIRPDYAAWRAYAQGRGVHPAILAYLDDNRDHFYVYQDTDSGTALVTARAWEDLSVMLTCLDRLGEAADLPLIAQYLQSGQVARNFYRHYIQYQWVAASGLLEQVLQGERGAVSRVRRLGAAKSWDLTYALIQRIRALSQEAVRRQGLLGAVHCALDFLEGGNPMDFEELLGQLEDVRDEAARAFLEDCVQMSREADGHLRIREALAVRLSLPAHDALQDAASAIESTASVCRRAMKDQPYLEFLVSGMMEDEAVAQVIGQSDLPEFRVLAETYYLDTEQEAADLRRLLEAESREEAQPPEPLASGEGPDGELDAPSDTLTDLLSAIFAPCGAETEDTL